MRRLLALALLGLVCLAFLGVVAYGGIIAPRPSARLAVIDGTVELQRPGNGSSGAARTGDAVQAGDALRTAASSHAAVSFGDGSLARLDQNSQLALNGLPASLTGSGLELLRGQAWFTLPRAGNPNLDVSTGGARLVSRDPGSEFSVLLSSSGLRVDSWAGAVQVSSAGGSARLEGEQSTEVPRGKSPGKTGALPAQDRGGSFTVLNRTLDIAHGGLLGLSGGTLRAHQSTDYMALPPADGQTNLQLAVGWAASQMQVVLQSPNGKVLAPVTLTTPPGGVEMPAAVAGVWQVKLTAGEVDTPWAVATSWRPAAPEEPDVIRFTEALIQVRASAKRPAELEAVEEGAALKDDLALLDLATRFPDGSDPIAVHWVTRDLNVDQEQAYVFRPRGGEQFAVSIAHSDLPTSSAGSGPVALLTLFRKTRDAWKAVYRLYTPSASNAALAVDADGYVTGPTESEQANRYSLTARGLQTSLVSYLNTGRINGVTVDDSLRRGRTAMNVTDDVGNRVVSQDAADTRLGTYGLPLQDGNLLVLTSLDLSVVVTPPPGKCLLQPDAEEPYGRFSALLGLPRGAYGSLKNSGVELYGVVVPSRTSADHHLRVVGKLGQAVPDGAQAPCTSGQKPLPVDAGASVEL
ncbi:MAG: FecR family protein [Candidatus Dormibacteraeota bacterium]|nr:FecR family protein [Candidatus Dormibacteraeota bacterium]